MHATAAASAVLSRDDLETFARDGIVRVPGAFTRADAEAMQHVVWRRLADFGIARDDPATWTKPFSKLNRVARHRAFAAILGERLRATIDQLVGAGRWLPPRNWGGVFVTFPECAPPWPLIADGWHSDSDPFAPTTALMALVCLDDLAPGGGGTLLVAGSPRRLARWQRAQAAALPSRARQRRRAFCASHPWLAELTGAAPDAGDRIARLRDASTATAEGDALRVVEVTGAAGDVVLCHPCVLHARSRNAADRPRMMRIAMVGLAPPWTVEALPAETPVARAIAPLA